MKNAMGENIYPPFEKLYGKKRIPVPMNPLIKLTYVIILDNF